MAAGGAFRSTSMLSEWQMAAVLHKLTLRGDPSALRPDFHRREYKDCFAPASIKETLRHIRGLSFG